MTLKPDTDAGISAGVKYWLFFMISLFLLRYDPRLSIILGAIGGAAGGFVEACLKAKAEDGPAKADKVVDQPEPATDSSALRKNPYRYGFGRMRTRRQQDTRPRFNLFFFRRRKQK